MQEMVKLKQKNLSSIGYAVCAMHVLIVAGLHVLCVRNARSPLL
jgi:hypothetical protein